MLPRIDGLDVEYGLARRASRLCERSSAVFEMQSYTGLATDTWTGRYSDFDTSSNQSRTM
jgi:hypothetical protein